jgi:hypothetical protein
VRPDATLRAGTTKVLARRLAAFFSEADLKGIWPALLIWSAALAGLWLTAYLAGYHPWLPRTWAHWDAGHYLDIARRGYDVHRCAPGEADKGGWCGNAAWFPGYPLLIAGLHGLGVPAVAAGVAIAWLFSAAALALLWRTLLHGLPAVAAVGGLIYAGWAAGQIYDYAVFPLSMLFFFTVAYLHLLHRGRWLVAGLAGAAAVLSYPIGVTLPIAATVWAVIATPRIRLRDLAQATIPSGVAFLAIVAIQRIQTGRWTAFWDVQRQYGHGFHDPFGVTWNALLLLVRNRSLDVTATAWQTVFVSALALAVFVHAVLRRRVATRLDLLLVVWMLVTWGFPLTQANVSVWRSQAALAPMAALVARLPRPVLAVSIAASIGLSVLLARLYFSGRLI